MTGRVSHLKKTYGHIHGDDGEDRLLLPNSVQGVKFEDLQLGQAVTFDDVPAPRAKPGQCQFMAAAVRPVES